MKKVGFLEDEDVPKKIGGAFMEVLGGQQGLQIGRELRKGRKRFQEKVGEAGLVERLGSRVIRCSQERKCGVKGETFDEFLVVFAKKSLEKWDWHAQF